MAVRPLVLAAERFVQPGQRAGFDRAAGHGHGQLERLAFVAAIRRAPDPHGGAGESLGRELSARLGLHPREHVGERRRLDAARPPPPRPNVVVLDVGEEEAERREESRGRRHDDAAHLELARHARREDRPVAAEREQRVLAGIAAALARDGSDRAHHVRRRDHVSAVGGFGQRQPESARDLGLEDLVGPRGVELHRAARELGGIHEPEDHVGVGDRRLGAAEVVAERAGEGARALRPDLEATARIDPHQRAAARAHLGEVDGGNAQQIARAGEQSRAGHDAAAHLIFGRARHLAVLHERRLRRRAAHVERHDLAEPDLPSERLGPDDAGRRSRLDDVDRPRRRRLVGHEAAVRLHDHERRLGSDAIEA